jgi:hypothetical protein
MPTVLTPSLQRLIARTIECARAAGRDQWSQRMLAAQKITDIHHGLTVREATALVDVAQRHG